MKKILITGANSYIGTSFEKWVKQWPGQYQVDTIDLIDSTWRETSFKGYDCVYHVAGIAHLKQTEDNKNLYYKVNRDLAIEVAQRAKVDGVYHFIFLSSMSVYGIEQGHITRDTNPNPNCHYGKSKYEAENVILRLVDENYKISILRPPMVYGKGCKGNFIKLNQFTNKIS
ncbi:NAD-dependent epimerase/dehydratase family protein, partial [Turicibacter sanguinis]|nr:NAD-dependent epimerase/dehydratase family protein [Turicibacter sanguinis]